MTRSSRATFHRSLPAELLTVVGLALVATPARAQDCGNVTFAGECVGTTLRYCDANMLVEYDCTVEYSANSTCETFNMTYGSNCASAVGETCFYDDGAGGLEITPCQGTNAGCLENDTDAVCTENLGACTAADNGTCRNGRLIVECFEFLQPHMLDCPALGGTCQTDRCADVPVGGFCDDTNAFCAAGLSCVNDVCSAGGPMGDAGVSGDAGATAGDAAVRADATGGPSDAGTSSRDATTGPVDIGFGFPDAKSSGGGARPGTGAAPAKSGCQCVGVPADGGSASLLAIVGLLAGVVVRRR